MKTFAECSGSDTRRGNGFTLLELLVVVTIVVLLVGLIVVVSTGALGTQRERQTEAVLRTLDRALSEYELLAGRFPPLAVDDASAATSNQTLVYAHEQMFRQGTTGMPNPLVFGHELYDGFNRNFGVVTQGVDFASDPALTDNRYLHFPTSWLFLELTEGFGDVQSILADLPEGLIYTDLLENSEVTVQVAGVTSGQADELVERRQVIDAWGNPILFVQPGSLVAEGLYGRALANRPYFLSAGLDENYGAGRESADVNELIGFTEDNLTSTRVGPIRTDAAFGTLRTETGL